MGPFMTAALPVGLNLASNMFGTLLQADRNKSAAERTYEYNKEMMHYQNWYNSPRQQMRRFKKAGLNPNLVYGQGSSGQMSSAPQYSEQVPDYQTAVSDLGSKFVRTQLEQAQTSLTGAKTIETRQKAEVLEVQEDVLRANPLLNPRYLGSIVTLMESTARMKKHDVDFLTSEQKSTGATTQGQAKVMLELEELASRLGLQKADAALKAKILESEELRRSLLDIQEKWLKDGDITSQHIFQGIMLMLTKFM